MEYKKILQQCVLFSKITEEEMEQILKELARKIQRYQKSEIVLLSEECIQEFGLLLSGALNIFKEDLEGNTMLLARIEPGELFAETFACSAQPLTVTVNAAEKSKILWLDYRKMLLNDENNRIYQKILQNLLQILAAKNLFLTRRIEHLTKRTLKEKLLSYFIEQSHKAGKRSFQIPFDRQGLADYLAADRSAVSAVLCKMRDEGLLEFHKNHFVLK